MYTVSDVMTTDLITLRENDDLGLADSIIHLGRIRHLPVVGKSGKLSGLVTQRDLLRAYVDRGEVAGKTVAAKDVMTSRVTKVTADTPLRKALKLMLRNKYGCLPVVDDGGRPVGIVTESDMVKFAASVITDLDRFQKNALAVAGV